jgi:DNA-directed RNA polymerase subunit RPC12/RpoP
MFGVYPWRCHHCHARFHGRLVPLTDRLKAHCPICGNQELKRISGDYVTTPFSFVWRKLGVPAYRCEPCRHKYFSIRPRNAHVHSHAHGEKHSEVGQLTSAD